MKKLPKWAKVTLIVVAVLVLYVVVTAFIPVTVVIDNGEAVGTIPVSYEGGGLAAILKMKTARENAELERYVTITVPRYRLVSLPQPAADSPYHSEWLDGNRFKGYYYDSKFTRPCALIWLIFGTTLYANWE